MAPVVVDALQSLPHREGPVFQTPKGRRYLDTGRSSGGQFSTAWAGACQRAGLPGTIRTYVRKGRQAGATYERFDPEHDPYVLRHTWASWHYRRHRDLVLLQHDGGWESQDMLGVYVHLMPEAYLGEIAAFMEGRIDLHLGRPSVDRRNRTVAVQSGRTSPLGRPKRSANR